MACTLTEVKSSQRLYYHLTYFLLCRHSLNLLEALSLMGTLVTLFGALAILTISDDMLASVSACRLFHLAMHVTKQEAQQGRTGTAVGNVRPLVHAHTMLICTMHADPVRRAKTPKAPCKCPAFGAVAMYPGINQNPACAGSECCDYDSQRLYAGVLWILLRYRVHVVRAPTRLSYLIPKTVHRNSQ